MPLAITIVNESQLLTIVRVGVHHCDSSLLGKGNYSLIVARVGKLHTILSAERFLTISNLGKISRHYKGREKNITVQLQNGGFCNTCLIKQFYCSVAVRYFCNIF
jgi:hypothetical protein